MSQRLRDLDFLDQLADRCGSEREALDLLGELLASYRPRGRYELNLLSLPEDLQGVPSQNARAELAKVSRESSRSPRAISAG